MCDKLRIIKDASLEEIKEAMHLGENRPSLNNSDTDIFVLENGEITQINGGLTHEPI